MPSGGHAASGPPPDPNSLNSARKGLTYTALPREGYAGEIPPWPLPVFDVFDIVVEDKRRFREINLDATRARGEREAVLWEWVWRTPQAAAWIGEPWRWQAVAHWVRLSAICESADASAADKNALHRFADQIGLTPQGMIYNGWKVAPDQVASKRDEKAAPSPSTRGRLNAVRDAAAGA